MGYEVRPILISFAKFRFLEVFRPSVFLERVQQMSSGH